MSKEYQQQNYDEHRRSPCIIVDCYSEGRKEKDWQEAEAYLQTLSQNNIELRLEKVREMVITPELIQSLATIVPANQWLSVMLHHPIYCTTQICFF